MARHCFAMQDDELVDYSVIVLLCGGGVCGGVGVGVGVGVGLCGYSGGT